MRAALVRLLRSSSGATILEYAFIGALISIVIVSVVAQIGTSVTDMFSQITNGF
ncbi:MAG TPA: Flp family type IVb pilin [Stellaceae bacterium]|nr:Flp family type IVb pilin [Stellaceae bacterium]